MVDPAASELVPPPSSPTNSSISSSDLDTESTGSFFHDRSTTHGSNLPSPTHCLQTPFSFSEPDHRRGPPEEVVALLQSRSTDPFFVGSVPRGGTALFADGRVLPPAVIDDGASTPDSLCSRFPVSLTGICSGGAGFG